MLSLALSFEKRGLARIFAWPRVVSVVVVSALVSVLLLPAWSASYAILLGRLLFIGFTALVTFGITERWPARLPRRVARWAMQVSLVALSVPLAAFVVYLFTTPSDAPPFWQTEARVVGFGLMTICGLLLAPWMAVSSSARSQALSFELARSELERKALDARLRLLQAQIEPHFLFNTLANVRELVDAGSPQASAVLGNLITYLRMAVPRLQGPGTVGQELELVRAYLEIMRMRMPDRLEFSVQADEPALPLECPPTTLLVLVENAVRHGIDPSEEGGRIEVRVSTSDGRCRAQVVDTGIGLNRTRAGLGTGLEALRERLALTFGADAKLGLVPVEPHGVCAELDFPARRSAA